MQVGKKTTWRIVKISTWLNARLTEGQDGSWGWTMNSLNICLLKHTWVYMHIQYIFVYLCICKNGNIHTDCPQYKEAHLYILQKRNILKCKQKYFTTQTMLILANIFVQILFHAEKGLTSFLNYVYMPVLYMTQRDNVLTELHD